MTRWPMVASWCTCISVSRVEDQPSYLLDVAGGRGDDLLEPFSGEGREGVAAVFGVGRAPHPAPWIEESLQAKEFSLAARRYEYRTIVPGLERVAPPGNSLSDLLATLDRADERPLHPHAIVSGDCFHTLSCDYVLRPVVTADV